MSKKVFAILVVTLLVGFSANTRAEVVLHKSNDALLSALSNRDVTWYGDAIPDDQSFKLVVAGTDNTIYGFPYTSPRISLSGNSDTLVFDFEGLFGFCVNAFTFQLQLFGSGNYQNMPLNFTMSYTYTVADDEGIGTNSFHFTYNPGGNQNPRPIEFYGFDFGDKNIKQISFMLTSTGLETFDFTVYGVGLSETPSTPPDPPDPPDPEPLDPDDLVHAVAPATLLILGLGMAGAGIATARRRMVP